MDNVIKDNLDNRTLDKLATCKEDDVNLLFKFLFIAHRMRCDIYSCGGTSNTRVLGIGAKLSKSKNATPDMNMFIKIDKGSIYLSKGNEPPHEKNKLTMERVISVLTSINTGSSQLPSHY